MHFINALPEFSASQRDYMNDEDSFRFKNKLTMDVKSEWELLDIKNDL